ncbi:virion structural protein [Escherichia phage iGC_PHA_EC001]|jgi:hypothetical protein|uniref:Tail protein n=3 Tax=Phapecoctavirus TaxID=2733124 RepID=A0A7T3N5K9_9CAUD|nr:baseplate hub [Escherichia phage ESCO5]YP_009985599.1 baseplate hub [Escherichia phage anhysbys]YP_010356190.1 MAG: baseplate hub [Dompiswa phage TSP7_1]EKQ5213275.1 hypothetical protein [Escherichia coli]UKM17354.1 putative baseplate hub [Escherichia phage SKA64]UPW40266.1 putative baseplate hub [Escherichia phage vB_EcoM_REC]WIL78695.1 hypothetical protein NWUPM10C3_149 [Escherichia phage vB_EcoM_10C3_SA_NWU]WIL79451.1 hypothetical protein NWUPM118_149 [Escherichia phage vB_EcoM_118_SA_
MAEREYTKAPAPNLNRAYKLLIGSATNTIQKRTKNSAFKSTVDLDTKLGTTEKSSSNLYLLQDHQITFSIKKDNNKDPNQAEIVVYNLSDDTVNYINRGIRNNLAVALAVGYEGEELVMIFKGTIQWVSDTFDSVDRKTTLHCLDGGINIAEARTSRSYPKGTKIKRVVTDLVKDLGTTEGNIHVDNDQTLSSATAMCGNTSHYLEHICKSIDHNVSIQDGSVYVTPRSQMSSARSAYISPETGLIGSPEPFHNDIKPTKKVTKSSKKAKKPTDGVKFKCQMNGAILPEKTIWLKSRDYDGPFKVVSVSHNGDKEGKEWVTEVECVSVSEIMTKEK